MKLLSKPAVALLIVTVMIGCEFKKNTSREEIPIIKESLGAFEAAIKARDALYIDSLLSSEAAEVGTTSASILDFVYADSLTAFAGFTQKQILFRGDAARVDCTVAGPDGPVREVTITLRKERNIWRIKKLEPRLDDPLKEDQDTAGK